MRAAEVVRPRRPRTTLKPIRLPPAQLVLAGWFAALSLLIAGPLLGAGHLMLLDFVGGPHVPPFSYMPLPSSGEVGNTIPLLSLQAALSRVHPYVPQKLLLLAPIFLGGLGVARFAVRRLEVGPLPAAYAGSLYAVNPFVYDRLSAGQLHLLLGYGLLPWAFASLVGALEEPGPGRILASASWLAALTAVSIHVAGMFALLVIAGQLVGAHWRGLLRAGASLGLAALLSAYWLVPSLFAPQGPRVGPADLEVYASRPRGPGILPVLLGLRGFWRDEFAGAIERVPVLALLPIPILSLSAVGVGRLVRMERRRPWAIALAIAAMVALLVAAGASFPPTAGLSRWAFDHVPFLGVYREPQKLIAILALAYAVFGAVGISALVEAVSRRRDASRGRSRATLVVAVLVASTFAYSYPILWGLWGDVSLARFPHGWEEADATMRDTGPGRLLVLPWTLYGVRSFAGQRIIAEPAVSFFSEEVLSNDEAGFEEVRLQTRDPFSAYVASILAHRDEVRAFGHMVAPLGVRYVVLFHEIDWQEYGFVRRQPDLALVYRDADVELYENTAWRGEILPLSGTTVVGGPRDVIGRPEEEQVTKSLFHAPPVVPRASGGLPAVADLLPPTSTIPPSEGSYVATGVRCTDGWRLGGHEAECHLGTVAAFSASPAPRLLRSGLTGAWAVGYAASTLTIAGLFAFRRMRALLRRKILGGTSGQQGHKRAKRPA